MKRLVLVVVLALILSFGGAGLSAAAIEAPTWTTGDTWTYRGFVGQSLTFTVLGPAGDGYSVEVKSASGMNILHYTRDLVTESADYFKPQWPLEVGKQW